MERQKRWQSYVIVGIILLTIYNILPTVFFYSKPLDRPIEEKRANSISLDIIGRVNVLEKEAVDWLSSFCKLIHVKPQQIKIDPERPEAILLSFRSESDAQTFRKFLPRAGELIAFVPSQLSLMTDPLSTNSKQVIVQRKIPVHFDPNQIQSIFQFSSKTNKQGQLTDLYRALINDRALQVGVAVGGPSENAQLLQGAITNTSTAVESPSEDITMLLAENILSFTKTFGENHPATQRYYASFTQTENRSGHDLITRFTSTLQQLREKTRLQKIALQQENERLLKDSKYLDPLKQQKMELLISKEKTLNDAEAIIARNEQQFASGSNPLTYSSFGALLQSSSEQMKPDSTVQTIALSGKNPFIDSIAIDWRNENITLNLYQDILEFRKKVEMMRSKSTLDQIDQWIFNSIAWTSREAREAISPSQDQFVIALNSLTNSKSFVAMRLSAIAKAQIDQIKNTLYTQWHPQHPDLQKDVFPVWDYETYLNLPAEDKKLGLVVYSPSASGKTPPRGFKMNSVYVVAKGLDTVLQRARSNPNAPLSQQFFKDFTNLRNLLQDQGLFGYAASIQFFNKDYAGDFVFEKEDYYQSVLKATRENFTVHGTQRYAVLEFTDVQQRILTENRIDDNIHEDLLRWRDDYRAAQMNLRGSSPFDVPKPTRNVLWDNFKLSFVKYFRGDDRKIVRWGLDLSGGKTVQIELRDSDNRSVTNESDIKQGINELYKRVNKMGVSEVSIRQEGSFITLDFPGSQGISASELVKASSMYFHVVNEKFSSNNPLVADATNRFLQEVWNEAVVTNRKDAEDINAIAFRHLYGDSLDVERAQPRSESAKILIDNGLTLANPLDTVSSSAFNDSLSKIAVMRGEDFTDWYGHTNPLLIVFRNYVLEGSSLENIHASYDPSKGNFLSFSVQGSHARSTGQKFDPREDFYLWTSQFSKEKIGGTTLANFSQGKGWRMAVILNGTVISAPTLDAALRDSAMITGGFTQREVNQLEADLKAGSLTFTPRILSEKNVSPELGAKEKQLGFLATGIAFILVVAAMVSYYRFGGIVASVALIFNLLIMWATLQNLHATLTLASIAGLILTLGMAVDANVLVFERIREEFAATGKIASAMHTGYKKAFSAIIDSNLTTIIAALILLHFDSGPIKFFAITLIIGIISSMFTALFMTRFYFAGWVQNPENKNLKMANWFKTSHFNFLKYTKITMILTTVVILIGLSVLAMQRKSIMGMDFTGGYALTVELKASPSHNYREQVEKAFLKQGASAQDFQVRELTPSNTLRIFISRSMDQQGKPFYKFPFETPKGELGYAFQSNPRLVWIVNALQQQGLSITSEGLKNLDANWTVVSGQISSTMRNSALIGLSLALLCILIYITIRFEFKYAISATLCLAHDVIFTIGVIAILHAFKVPLQIDLNTVAALMTIIGYSLNDTIIVFDRIRENVKGMRKTDFATIINHSLNATLGRTLMTSGTTLLVLIPLIVLGGSTIFGFALVMSIGVIFGTLSSLFIAAPLMQFFHKREKAQEQAVILQE